MDNIYKGAINILKKISISSLFIFVIYFITLTISLAGAEESISEPPGETNIHEAGSTIRDYTEFNGKFLGAISGSICGGVGEDIGATSIYYSVEEAIIADVRSGKLDGFVHDWSVLKVLVGLPGNEDLECVEIPAEIFSAPMGAMSARQDIITRFNIFLQKTKDDGILFEMQRRWLENVPDEDTPMPDIDLIADNGTLKVAVTPTALPFVYKDENGNYKGYSAELAIRFAAHEGMELEFIDMDFSGLVPYTISGKADFAIANVSITEERKKIVLFSDSIYDDRQGVLALKKNLPLSEIKDINRFSITDARKNRGISNWFNIGFSENKISHSQRNVLLAGVLVALLIAVAAELMGVIIGFFISGFLASRKKLLFLFGRIFCHLMNGLPVVVVVLLLCYIIFPWGGLSGTLIGIIAFALSEGAALASVFKATAETENAKGTAPIKFRKLIKLSMKPVAGRFSSLIKKTSIFGFTAIYDLILADEIAWADNHASYFSLMQTLSIYFIIITLFILIFNYISDNIN